MAKLNFGKYEGYSQQCDTERCINKSEYVIKPECGSYDAEFRICDECAKSLVKSISDFAKQKQTSTDVKTEKQGE